jgi:STE24 endopeptidase
MDATLILALFAAALALETGVDMTLTLLNLRHVRRNASTVPAAFQGIVELEAYRRSVDYTLVRGRFSLLVSGVSSAALLVIAATGLLGIMDALIRALPVHPYGQGILFIAAVSFGAWLLRLPFSLVSTFGIEARFGFNRTTPRLFIVDSLKGFVISAVIGVPVLAGLFWFMDRTGRFWWTWAFAATTIFQLGMNIITPLVIAPLFNRFTPLAEGPLRERILALARSLGFRTNGIFIVDSSRRSRHSNAYFTGLGRAKRIVLFDTLVATGTEDEILAVLAHEIGHEKLHHVSKGMLVSVLFSLAGFWIVSLLMGWGDLYLAFGFTVPGYQAILVLLAFCSGPFVYFLQPLLSMRSRRQEYLADRFAVRGVGSASGLRSALLRLSRENLSNLTPHPVYSFFHYSHPTLAERIRALEKVEGELAGSPRGAHA